MTSLIIQKGLHFEGFLIEREYHYAVELDVGNEVNINSSTFLGIPVDWDRTSIRTLYNGKMKLLHNSTNLDIRTPTCLNDAQEKCIDMEVLMAFLKPGHGQCEVELKINPMMQSSNSVSGSDSFAIFMTSITSKTVSCWLKGDILVGLMKTEYGNTGCFVVQLKQQGKLSLLALRKIRESSPEIY